MQGVIRGRLSLSLSLSLSRCWGGRVAGREAGTLTFELCPPVEHLGDISRHDPLYVVQVVLESLEILLGPCVDVEFLGLFDEFVKMIHRADELVRSRCGLHLAPVLVMELRRDFRQERHG